MARSFLGGEFAGGESAWWRGNWIPFIQPAMFHLINREALTVLYSVMKHAGSC